MLIKLSYTPYIEPYVLGICFSHVEFKRQICLTDSLPLTNSNK